MTRATFRIGSAAALTFVLGLAACTAGWQWPRDDNDLDGVSDTIENELLARYRPYYRFSRDHDSDEPIRPTDPIWYIGHSDLRSNGDEDDSAGIIVPQSTLALNPQAILISNGMLDTNINSHRCRSDVFLNPGNAFRSGFSNGDGHDWPEIERVGNVGLFGHVSKSPYDQFLQIEYWQFYGYNEVEQVNDTADHEGDWELISLTVADPTLHAPPGLEILSIDHFMHGKSVGFFLPTGDPVYVNDETGLVREKHGFTYSTYATADLDLYNDVDRARAHNVILRFHCENNDRGACTHPIVYVEWGGHGSWPTAEWNWLGAPKHNGSGRRFLTSTPPNLGEPWLPASPAAAVIMQFNGHWGAFSRSLPGLVDTSTPFGPTLHRAWNWGWGLRPDNDCLE